MFPTKEKQDSKSNSENTTKQERTFESLDQFSLWLDEELDVLEHLMSAPDRDLFKWISGEDPTPANYQSDVLIQIQRFHGV